MTQIQQDTFPKEAIGSNPALNGDNPLYLHSVKLSNLLNSLKLTLNFNGKLEYNEVKNISSLVSKIISDLTSSDFGPSTNIGNGPTTLEAYKILVFSLIILQNNSTNQKLSKMQQKYDDLLESSSDITAIKLALETSQASCTNLQKENSQLQVNFEKYKKKYEKSKRANALLIKYLIQKFNLPPDTNHSNIIENMKKDLDEHPLKSDQKSKNQSFEPEMLRHENEFLKLELSNNQQLIKDMNEKILTLQKALDSYENIENSSSSNTFILENDIKSFKEQYKKLESQNKNNKKKLEMIKNENSLKTEQLIKKKEELESIKLENEKLTLENEDLKTQIRQNLLSSSQNLTKIQEQQIQYLQTALQELSNEMESVNDNLMKETEIRNKLFEIVQKQTNALSFAEITNTKLSNQLHKTKEDSTILNNKLEQFKNDQKEIINLLNSYFEENEQEIHKMLNDTSIPIPKKINNIIDLIKKNMNESKKEYSNEKNHNIKDDKYKEENHRLLNYISNLLGFMEQISNSGEIQGWLIDTNNNPLFREHLISQCKRVESFLRINDLNYENETNDFFDLPNYSLNVASQIENPSVEELMILLKQSAYANDVLRKFNEEIKLQCKHLLFDMKSMQNELEEANNTLQDKVEETTSDLHTKLEEEKDKNKVLNKIKNILRNAKNPNDNSIFVKCIDLINQKNNDKEDENDLNIEKYIRQLEHRLNKANKLITHNKNEYEGVIKNLNLQMKSNAKSWIQQSKQYEEEINGYKLKNEEVSKHLKEIEVNVIELQNSLEQTQKENKEIKQKLETQNKEIESFHKLRMEELEAQQNEFEEKIKELQNQKESEINNLNKCIQSTENKSKQEQKYLQHLFRIEIKKLQNECNLQTQKAEALRSHFEPIISNLKNKLAKSRESELNMQKQYTQMESELKETKASLSKQSIDNKIKTMKLKATEEKIHREKSSYEAQMRVKLMELDTDYKTKMEEFKYQSSQEMYKFLLIICEQFKDFFDEHEPISKSSILSLLQKVSKEISNSKSLVNANDELNSLRTMLLLQPNESIVYKVKQLKEKVDDFEKNEKLIQEERIEADNMIKKAMLLNDKENASKEWEQWAKRLHLFITDQFSIAKTPKELQNELEEALLSTIGQRKNWRKIEILRTEKNIFQSGLLNNRAPRKKISILTLVTVFNCVYRVKKLSGHLNYNGYLANKGDVMYIKGKPTKEKKEKSPKKYPIVNLE